jgi:hypothetical protein
MLRVSLANNWVKSSLRPLYANTQATPQNMYLDPAWDRSIDIFPGMVLMKTSGELVSLVNAAGSVPFGLAGFYEAPVFGLTQIANQGTNACPVWVLGPDSRFEVLSDAFDTSLTWTDTGDGTGPALVSAYAGTAKRGKLCPAGTGGALTTPIARLIKVVSTQKLIIGGLQGRVA